MQHSGEVAPAQLEAVRLILAHVPRAAYVVGETGRIHAVNALAACSPQDVDPHVQRALTEVVKPSSRQAGFVVIALPAAPAPLFVVLGQSEPDPVERGLPAIATRFQLTPAETDVLRWWVRGLTQRQIAARRGTEEGTVHIQLQHIRSKLGVSRRREIETLLRSQVGL